MQFVIVIMVTSNIVTLFKLTSKVTMYKIRRILDKNSVELLSVRIMDSYGK